MENILIIGASGHAKVIVDIIEKQKQYNIYGFLDTFKKKGDKLFEYTILGSENDLNEIVEKNNISGCFIAIGDNCTRKIMSRKISTLNPNLKFINAIHPSSIIGKEVTLGHGIAIMPGVVVNSDSKIGDFCILNTNSSLGHDGVMNDYSSISSGVRTGGNLKLNECSAISIGATIIENIVIGRDTIIGAGSLVTKNIPSEVVAYGIPAKIIKSRRADDKYLFGEKNKTGRS
ncbi:acetyltransferase [Arenibacter sp. ARW7G5Y1]|uniref:acetyltransferase n=1 Tax=Arenibacter sp. ARW7G5Y1 TaxID=2135619 RepID=UPI000D7678FA|nr:acetyltransferase [Arenibacter sp. ARW7G5Y1]PXX28377.1 sugar O-acyltransferase (sialic acid O-acetyltransferase NeuD family) [Arenibacter sp. ARW7G5Y1]